MMKKHIITALAIYYYAALPAHSTSTTLPSNNTDQPPAFITADKIFYNQNNKTVIASGNVEISQDGRILIADKIIYSQNDETIYAEDNVSFLEKNGDVIFADEIKLTQRMKQAIITALKVRLRNNALLAASFGTKTNKNTYILNNAVYSPCNVCNTINKTPIPPLWQIKANDITLDEANEEIRYSHAWLEILGTPTIYTPYLSHATPDAKRKSGFLTPTYGNSSSLGTLVKTPYYWNISSNYDATVTPVYTGNEGPLLMGSVRHLTRKGYYELSGSVTHPDQRNELGQKVLGEKELRSHINGYGHFNLKNDWSWGFSGKRASDDTYLRRYNFGDETYLTTNLYSQQLESTNYMRLETLSFQGVQANDNPKTTPLISPLINTHHEFIPQHKLGYYTLDTNTLVVNRDEGSKTRRLSLTGGWNTSFTSTGGHLFTLNNTIRADGYSIHNSDPLSDTQTKSRIIPQTELLWSLPLIKNTTNHYIILEPTSNIIISPYGSHSDIIPNEDSQFAEIADYNLFSTSRFSGLDKVEEGSRVNYGLKGHVRNNHGHQLSFLAGQGYRPKKTKTLSTITGFNDRFSDIIGRIQFSSNNLFHLSYRFRADKNNLQAKRNEIESRISWKSLKLNVQYISLNESSNTALGQREEVLASSSFKLSPSWLISTRSRHDLSDNGGAIYSGANILYSNSCLDISLDWFREFTRDRDIEPSTSMTMQISLKGLN